jgi:hypothetical protein
MKRPPFNPCKLKVQGERVSMPLQSGGKAFGFVNWSTPKSCHGWRSIKEGILSRNMPDEPVVQ